jgi:hypothetical protein
MNTLYFSCTDCKIYTNAGYRWAYWTLEDKGIVQKGMRVSVNAFMGAEEYWNPPAEATSNWLYDEVLPGVRAFLQEHNDHRIIFADSDNFLFSGSDDTYFEWLQVGYLANISPRTLVEKLGFKTWEEANDYLSKHDSPPWWWDHTEELRDQGKAKFEELVGADPAI